MTGQEDDRQTFDARLHLLSRQVLDIDGVPVTTADDLELAGPGGPSDTSLTGADQVTVDAILSGPVLWTRVFGGRPPTSRYIRVPWRDVGAVTTVVNLTTSGESLDVTWPERWARDHLIARIPGGRHDPQ